MLLAIDVGNSQTVLGVFEGARLAHHWRLSTLIDRTADEFALEIAGLLGLAGLAFPGDIDGIAICSVVPEVTQRLRDMSVRYSGTEALVVRPGIKLGMPIRMDDPREVGADRLVNAVAAYASVGGPAIVVDFGTATSFDVVSARGEFIGGAIAPGVSTSMTALAARGAQLRTVEIAAPRQAIGRNTVEAMQSGAVYGFAGQVDRIVEALVEALGTSARVISTGGAAGEVVARCRRVERHEPWLTLEGLLLVWTRNR